MSQLEDLSAQQTSSNFALTVEIEGLKEKQDETIMEKENLENQLERTSFSHAEEKIKLESTLAQQTKLIDFLQKKVMVDDRNFASAPKKKDKVLYLFCTLKRYYSRILNPQGDRELVPHINKCLSYPSLALFYERGQERCTVQQKCELSEVRLKNGRENTVLLKVEILFFIQM